jgi:hypothetical protein
MVACTDPLERLPPPPGIRRFGGRDEELACDLRIEFRDHRWDVPPVETILGEKRNEPLQEALGAGRASRQPVGDLANTKLFNVLVHVFMLGVADALLIHHPFDDFVRVSAKTAMTRVDLLAVHGTLLPSARAPRYDWSLRLARTL